MFNFLQVKNVYSCETYRKSFITIFTFITQFCVCNFVLITIFVGLTFPLGCWAVQLHLFFLNWLSHFSGLLFNGILNIFKYLITCINIMCTNSMRMSFIFTKKLRSSSIFKKKYSHLPVCNKKVRMSSFFKKSLKLSSICKQIEVVFQLSYSYSLCLRKIIEVVHFSLRKYVVVLLSLQAKLDLKLGLSLAKIMPSTMATTFMPAFKGSARTPLG